MLFKLCIEIWKTTRLSVISVEKRARDAEEKGLKSLEKIVAEMKSGG